MSDNISTQETKAMKAIDVAKICHEANRALCESHGDTSQVSWEQAPDWQKDSALAGVKFAFLNPAAPPSAQHESWSDAKLADGWRYGEVKDATAKTHPCLVPFDQLPPEQQAKDKLFKGICNALLGVTDPGF